MGTKVRQALGSGRPREGRGWCGGEGLGRPRVWGWGRSAEGEGGGKGRKRKTEKRKIELDEVDVGTTAQHGTKDLSSSWDECLDNFLSEDPNTGTPWFWRPVLRRNGGSMSPLRKKEQDYSHCCSSSTATGVVVGVVGGRGNDVPVLLPSTGQGEAPDSFWESCGGG